jgi:hypothetical protein
MRSFCVAVLRVTQQALTAVLCHWQQQGILSSSSKVPIFLSSSNQILIFSTDFQKGSRNQISQKSLQWKCS